MHPFLQVQRRFVGATGGLVIYAARVREEELGQHLRRNIARRAFVNRQTREEGANLHDIAG